jgi:hypothetical protein
MNSCRCSTVHSIPSFIVISGQVFNLSDWGKNLALVSEKTAKMLWPGKNPVGIQFRHGDRSKEQPFTVVGVVANAQTVL